MNEVAHMTPDLLERFANRELGASDVLAVEEHLAACETCARMALARAGSDLSALHHHFLEQAPVLVEHPDRVRELAPYARGMLDAADRELVESHLDECATCHAEVARIRAARRSGNRWRWLAAAAVVALAIVTYLALRRTNDKTIQRSPVVVNPPAPVPREHPTPAPRNEQIASGYDDPAWDSLVAQATQSGRLPVPADLITLHGTDEVLRGEHVEKDRVQPAGVVLDDVRPTFSWPSREGSTYSVFIFDGNREIAHSAPLNETRWTPDRDLPRGRTLTWQVEAAHGEEVETIPSPPAPMARFRIATNNDHRDLTRARALHPNDDLLLGVLYARAGLMDDAASSLRRAAKTNAAAAKLLNENFKPTD